MIRHLTKPNCPPTKSRACRAPGPSTTTPQCIDNLVLGLMNEINEGAVLVAALGDLIAGNPSPADEDRVPLIVLS